MRKQDPIGQQPSRGAADPGSATESARHLRRALAYLTLTALPYVLAIAVAHRWLSESSLIGRVLGGDLTRFGALLFVAPAVAACRASIAAMNARAPGTAAPPTSSAMFILSVLATVGTGLVALALLIIN